MIRLNYCYSQLLTQLESLSNISWAALGNAAARSGVHTAAVLTVLSALTLEVSLVQRADEGFLTLQDAYLRIPAAPAIAPLPQLPELAAGFSPSPDPPGGQKEQGGNEKCDKGVPWTGADVYPLKWSSKQRLLNFSSTHHLALQFPALRFLGIELDKLPVN